MQGRTSGPGTTGNPSSYVPYEPKKREMTQKIAPKMPMPMSQDLTNLPLPHNHVSGTNENKPQKSASNATGSKLIDRSSNKNVGSHHHTSGHTSKSGGIHGSRMTTSQQVGRGMSPNF